MVNKNKRKGTAWETSIVHMLREQGFQAERVTLAGRDDEGDIVVMPNQDHGVPQTIVEAKNEKTIRLSDYVEQAVAERNNYCNKRGLDVENVDAVVFVKRRGKNVLDGYAVTTIREYLRIGN